MKKFIIMTLLFVGISFAASAQEAVKHNCQVIYVEDISDGSTVIHPYWYIDRTAKKIYSDDPTDPEYVEHPEYLTTLYIKSVKKEGNKETFSLTNGAQHEATFTLVLVINPKLTSKDDLSSQKITLTAGHTDSKQEYKAMIYDQLPDEEKESIEASRRFQEQERIRKQQDAAKQSGAASSADAASSPQSGLENAKDKVTGGVKNAFNKTKDLFKKKDK